MFILAKLSLIICITSPNFDKPSQGWHSTPAFGMFIFNSNCWINREKQDKVFCEVAWSWTTKSVSSANISLHPRRTSSRSERTVKMTALDLVQIHISCRKFLNAWINTSKRFMKTTVGHNPASSCYQLWMVQRAYFWCSPNRSIHAPNWCGNAESSWISLFFL